MIRWVALNDQEKVRQATAAYAVLLLDGSRTARRMCRAWEHATSKPVDDPSRFYRVMLESAFDMRAMLFTYAEAKACLAELLE